MCASAGTESLANMLYTFREEPNKTIVQYLSLSQTAIWFACLCVRILFCVFLGRQNHFEDASHDIIISMSGYACIFS